MNTTHINYIHFPKKEDLLLQLANPSSYPNLSEAEQKRVYTSFSGPIQKLSGFVGGERIQFRTIEEVAFGVNHLIEIAMRDFRKKREQELKDYNKPTESFKTWVEQAAEPNEAAEQLLSSLKPKMPPHPLDLEGKQIDLDAYTQLALKILGPALTSCGKLMSMACEVKSLPPPRPLSISRQKPTKNVFFVDPLPKSQSLE